MSAVVATFNRRAVMVRAVQALLEDPATWEVVVVVDGARDGSIEALEQIAADEPRLRPVFQENTGTEGARQAAAEVARGEVLLLLDDDVIALPGMVGAHRAQHVAGSRRLVVGYMPVPPPTRRAGCAPTILYQRDYETAVARYAEDPGSILRGLWGGNVSLRREDALRIGLDSGRRLRYHEDMAFGLRCAEAGLEPIFEPRARARHLHQRSVSAFARECRGDGAARVDLLAAGRQPDLGKASPDLPLVLRGALRANRLPGVAPVASRLLTATAVAAGRVGAGPVEIAATRLLRQVEIDRGIRDRSRIPR